MAGTVRGNTVLTAASSYDSNIDIPDVLGSRKLSVHIIPRERKIEN